MESRNSVDWESVRTSLREKLHLFRTNCGYPCKASVLHHMVHKRKEPFWVYENAVRAFKQLLNLLKSDLPQEGSDPQVIGSSKKLYSLEPSYLRDSVSVFVDLADYDPQMKHVVSPKYPAGLGICDGSLQPVSLKELLSNFDQYQINAFKSRPPEQKGNAIEDHMFNMLQRLLKDGYPAITLEKDKNIYSSRDYRILTAELDGFIKIAGNKKGCLEIKFTTYSPEDSDFVYVSDNKVTLIPEHKFWRQVQAYLHIMKLDFCWLMVFFEATSQYACIHVEKDTGRFNKIYTIFIEDKFIQTVFDELFTTDAEDSCGIQFDLDKNQLRSLVDHLCEEIQLKKQNYLDSKNPASRYQFKNVKRGNDQEDYPNGGGKGYQGRLHASGLYN